MMGLSAFNRARQIRAQMNEQNKQAEMQTPSPEAGQVEDGNIEPPLPPNDPSATPPTDDPEKPKKQSGGKK